MGNSWMLLAAISCVIACAHEQDNGWDTGLDGNVKETVAQIQSVQCRKTDAVLRSEGLHEDQLGLVRDFCRQTLRQMAIALTDRFEESRRRAELAKTSESFYACTYEGYNTGIPSYSDLGLSSGTCSWHDPNPECQVFYACLWGCNNVDPSLGWHIKWYTSRSALEADIFPKGYSYVSGTGEGGGYRRTLPNGYSYQVHSLTIDANGMGNWHNEGPEPDPRFNWSGYLGGWWPYEVKAWHDHC